MIAKQIVGATLAGLLICLMALPVDAGEARTDDTSVIGKHVENINSLRDARSWLRPLDSYGDNKALVLVFIGNECPLAKLYIPRLIEMQKTYGSQGVQFLAINSNEAESLEKMAGHAYDHDIPFPVLKDMGHLLADALGAQRTPETFVLDSEFVVRYHGRIDDQYGVGFRQQKAKHHDLVNAIDQVLAGEPVVTAETPASGCIIDRQILSGHHRKGVTYTKDVSRVIQKNCQECHRPGQSGPFTLMNFEDAVAKAGQIKDVVLGRQMPPWHADPRYGKFRNDRRLEPEEINTIVSWVNAGTPRGNPKDLPEPIEWVEGWRIGTPDVVFELPEAVDVPAEGVMPYLHFTVQTGFKEDRWVVATEAVPDMPTAIHHIIVYIKIPGKPNYGFDGSISLLGGFAPGSQALICRPGIGIKIPKEAELQFEMHYTPNGIAGKDRSKIGLIFAKEPPERELIPNVFAQLAFRIPPGAQHHRQEHTFTFKEDARILSLLPHMHWRGKSFHYTAEFPDGRKEVLLSTPGWDFNWQIGYQFAEPIFAPKGTKIHAVAHWDNSKNNPYNPDPTKEVRFGLQTWEEMMNGWITYVRDKPKDKQVATKN